MIRSLCTDRIKIARKGLDIVSSNKFKKTNWTEVANMQDIPAYVRMTKEAVIFKLEGLDERASDSLTCIYRLDNGLPVDIKPDDRIMENVLNRIFRVVDLKLTDRNGTKFYHAYLIQEGNWTTTTLTTPV